MSVKLDIEYSSFAFISYSHKDIDVAKWLQRRLESFKLPIEIHNDIDADSRYLRPIFRDQSDLNTGILGEELRKHLEESKYLIVICSKNSTESSWVSEEVKIFIELGRLKHIIPVIIPDGITSESNLFPKYLRNYFIRYPGKELLGINIGEIGKEKTLIRIVSRMLEVSFDSLWKRHQRQQRAKIILWSGVSFFIGLVVYLFAIPVGLTIEVKPEKSKLPVGESITLNVNGGDYNVSMNNPQIETIHLVGYNRFKDIVIKVSSKYYVELDTVIPTGFGLRKEIILPITRDDTFSTFAGVVFNSELNPLKGVQVSVAGYHTFSDGDGRFWIYLPIDKQQTEYTIILQKSGYKSVLREDESPGDSLQFIMHEL